MKRAITIFIVEIAAIAVFALSIGYRWHLSALDALMISVFLCGIAALIVVPVLAARISQ